MNNKVKHMEIKRYSLNVKDVLNKKPTYIGKVVIKLNNVIQLEKDKIINLYKEGYSFEINNVDGYATLTVINVMKVNENDPDFIEYIINEQDYENILWEI